MSCNNPDHHQHDGNSCDIHQHNKCCEPHHRGHHDQNPHDHHYHLNKTSVRGWVATLVYLSLHAVEIYLLLRLV